jgi:hypothetical protein
MTFIDTFDTYDSGFPNTGDLGQWDSAVSPTTYLHEYATGHDGKCLRIGANSTGNSYLLKNLDLSSGYNGGVAIGFWWLPNFAPNNSTAKSAMLFSLSDNSLCSCRVNYQATNTGTSQIKATFIGNSCTFAPTFNWNTTTYPMDGNHWYWLSFLISWGVPGQYQQVLFNATTADDFTLSGLPWILSNTNGDGNGNPTQYLMPFTESQLATTQFIIGAKSGLATGLNGTHYIDTIFINNYGSGFIPPIIFTIASNPPSMTLLGIG